MKHELRAALLPLVVAVLASCAAHAGGYADAAITNGQGGGRAPTEMDLLGSPRTYADPCTARRPTASAASAAPSRMRRPLRAFRRPSLLPQRTLSRHRLKGR
ncbi:hypothetical protein BHUM_02588 [Candidatus Burkholderia humilis]|nr:hypothetical protein BHUM_02588 [Candidatus Burkholderia humilis]